MDAQPCKTRYWVKTQAFLPIISVISDRHRQWRGDWDGNAGGHGNARMPAHQCLPETGTSACRSLPRSTGRYSTAPGRNPVSPFYPADVWLLPDGTVQESVYAATDFHLRQRSQEHMVR